MWTSRLIARAALGCAALAFASREGANSAVLVANTGWQFDTDFGGGSDPQSSPITFTVSPGHFELKVLGAIRRNGDHAWGAVLRSDLSNLLGRDVAVGQLYLALGRLEDRGFISAESQQPTARRGGRSKKLFKLEALGERALVDATTNIRRALTTKDVTTNETALQGA